VKVYQHGKRDSAANLCAYCHRVTPVWERWRHITRERSLLLRITLNALHAWEREWQGKYLGEFMRIHFRFKHWHSIVLGRRDEELFQVACYANTLRVFDKFISMLRMKSKIEHKMTNMRTRRRKRCTLYFFEIWVIAIQSKVEFLRLHALHWRRRVPLMASMVLIRRHTHCLRLARRHVIWRCPIEDV